MMNKIIFFTVLAAIGLILSAGCIYDRDIPGPSENSKDSEDPYGLEQTNETVEDEEEDSGYEESYNTMGSGGILDKAEGYYNEEYASDAYVNQATVVSPAGTDNSDEDEYDYAIDNYGETGSNPVDAIKNPENYSVQDSGTVILNTDSGEIDN
ncbi:hypothetical protein [Methanoplanus endosymbiosus]|uniref:Uncharacterized protein n=1 Tax=Methanoplanus endosymbiosus TaxID=33865 RepID=A0A9E7TIS3_9EURY|nr:hypothetical protein [Methanoplanus endosymbiosus]UUX92863.1 hypothetical protein L6E24_01675 [Methanoplanus endosymbiosus]